MRTDDIENILSGGKVTSLGRAKEVLHLVKENPDLFSVVFDAVFLQNRVVNTRASHVVKTFVKTDPSILADYKKRILSGLKTTQGFTLMHMLELVADLDYEHGELVSTIATIEHILKNSTHKFVKVNCLQALADLALRYRWLKGEIIGLIEEGSIKGSASIQARARKLLLKLNSI